MPRSGDLVAVARELALGLERWLLPAECLLCHGVLPRGEADRLVCGLCRSRWRPVTYPLCARCGQPAVGEISCRLCADWSPALGRVRSAVLLEETARAAVHRLKYDGWWRTSEAMAAAMHGLEPLTGQVSLVPVPLGRSRLRARGYNQSAMLAHALAACTGLPVADTLLERPRETATQTALTPEARHANVAGAFRARAGSGATGGRYVLVDDVFTTGATLCAAAEALAAAGAAAVDAVTFARAGEPLPTAATSTMESSWH